MKFCVVGYGAMGKIISEMLGDDLACNVALECKYKKLDETDGNFDCIIDFSNPANLDMIIDYANNDWCTDTLLINEGYHLNGSGEIVAD